MIPKSIFSKIPLKQILNVFPEPVPEPPTWFQMCDL